MNRNNPNIEIANITMRTMLQIAKTHNIEPNDQEMKVLEKLFHALTTSEHQLSTLLHAIDQFERRLAQVAQLKKNIQEGEKKLLQNKDDAETIERLKSDKDRLQKITTPSGSMDNYEMERIEYELSKQERLIKKYNGILEKNTEQPLAKQSLKLALLEKAKLESQLHPVKSLLLDTIIGSVIVASKVAEDASVWNTDYQKTLGNEFSIKHLNKIERIHLELLEFNTSIPKDKDNDYDESGRLAKLFRFMTPKDLAFIENELRQFKHTPLRDKNLKNTGTANKSPSAIQKGIFASHMPSEQINKNTVDDTMGHQQPNKGPKKGSRGTEDIDTTSTKLKKAKKEFFDKDEHLKGRKPSVSGLRPDNHLKRK